MNIPKPLSSFKNFVFSAGGNGGYCFIGGLLSLMNIASLNGYRFYDQVEGLAGCSIGSAICFFMCLRMSMSEIECVMNINLKKLFKFNFDLQMFKKTFGLFNILMAKPIFEKLLIDRDMDPDITFLEFYNKTNILLKITVTNLSKRQVEYHSKLTVPNFKVIDSLLASMTIPGAFSPYVINHNFYVDGAITDSFPIDQFDKDTTLGLCLERSKVKFDSLQNYMFAIFTLTTKRCVNVDYNIITISTEDISRLSPSITASDKQKLIINGMIQTVFKFRHDLLCKILAIQFIEILLILGSLTQMI